MNNNEESEASCQEAKSRLRVMLATNSAFKKWKKQAGTAKNRYMRLKELILTEEDYYKDLKMLREKIKLPLIENKIISQTHGQHMFYNLQSMMELSLQIKRGLLLMMESWNSRTTKVGEYMAVYAQFLLVYSDYFKNLNETQRRMKELSQMNPEVRQLEKLLSTQNKIVTFQDLIMKPFQRPLKYHLILKDYLGKMDEGHLDYQPLKKAIASYHQVNLQNNKQLMHKERDHILIDLDAKYGNIIESQVRFYVATYSTLFLQIPVTMYIFSDLVVLINRTTEKENIRIYLNKFSTVIFPTNQLKYPNGLYLYGEKKCAYLCFENENLRGEAYFKLKELIQDISRNEFDREKIMSLRVTRMSTDQGTIVQTYREPQLVRPLLCTVVGYEKRKVSNTQLRGYYVIQFRSTQKESDIEYPPQQLSFISWEDLLKIEQFIRYHYALYFRSFPLSFVPFDLTVVQLNSEEGIRYEFQSILIQLFLNSIFRSEIILKRIDIVCKMLNICDALWKHLGSPYSQLCFCQFCIQVKQYEEFHQYEDEVKRRLFLKQQRSRRPKNVVELCEIRTINSQLMIANLPIANLHNLTSTQRISWVKARRGIINYSLTNIRPANEFIPTIKITVWFYSIKGKKSVQVEVFPNSRVKHIVEKVGQNLNMDLEDYTLELQMSENRYVLSEDELVRNFYMEDHEHEGIISKFFDFFAEDTYLQTFYLKKMWVMPAELEICCDIQKMHLQVEEIICRLKTLQLRLGSEEIYSIIAAHFAYHHFQELDVLNNGVIELRKQEFAFLLPKKFRERKYLVEVYEKIKDIKSDKNMGKDDLLRRIMSIVIHKPGWSCIMFKATQRTNEGFYIMKVKIGCDIRGVQVINEESKAICKYEFRHEQQWSSKLIGECLIIKCSEKQYYFRGRQLWKVKQQIQFYHTYYRTFMKK